MKKIILGMVICGVLVGGNFVLAADNSSGSSVPDNSSGNKTQTQTITPLQNPLKATSVKEVIFLAVDLAVYIGVIFAILAIIFVGFKFVAAQGKPDELAKAKEWFLWIIIGLAIIISARVMVEIVKTTLIKSGVVNEGVFDTKI